jgi:hypothetical protein
MKADALLALRPPSRAARISLQSYKNQHSRQKQYVTTLQSISCCVCESMKVDALLALRPPSLAARISLR